MIWHKELKYSKSWMRSTLCKEDLNRFMRNTNKRVEKVYLMAWAETLVILVLSIKRYSQKNPQNY